MNRSPAKETHATATLPQAAGAHHGFRTKILTLLLGKQESQAAGSLGSSVAGVSGKPQFAPTGALAVYLGVES